MEQCSSHVPGDIIMQVCDKSIEDIIENLSFDVAMDHIITRRVLTNTETRDIRDETRTSAKVRALVELVKKRGNNAYDAFLKALKKTKQDNLFERIKRIEQNAIANVIHTPIAESPSKYKTTEPDKMANDEVETNTSSEAGCIQGDSATGREGHSGPLEQGNRVLMLTIPEKTDVMPNDASLQDGEFFDIKSPMITPLNKSKNGAPVDMEAQPQS